MHRSSQRKSGTPAVYVDPPNETLPELNLEEQNEDNNFRISSSGILIAPRVESADIAPLNVVANPTSTDVLRDVTVSFDISNLGEMEATSTQYGIYLSEEDEVLDPEDILLGEGVIQPLSPGESQSIANLVFRLENEITTSTNLYVIVRADVLGVVDESNEANNFAVSERAIEVHGAQEAAIDLYVYDLTVNPETTYLQGQTQVTFKVTNLGVDDPGTYKCGIYLSEDSDPSPENDRLLILAGGENLPYGTEEEVERFIFIPNYITPGNYQIFAMCDPDDSISETDEENNVAGPSTVIINAEPQIDFTVSNVTISPNTIPENDYITFVGEICNIGDDYADIVGVNAYLSADAEISTEDRLVGQAQSSAALAPGACESFEITNKVDCLFFIDEYRAGLIVDPTNSLVETDEANNTFVNSEITTITGELGSYCSCIEDTYEATQTNNTQEEATPIVLAGDPLAARINELSLCDDADFYSVDLNRGDTLTVTLTYDATKNDIDLRLYDSNDEDSPFLSSSSSGTDRITHQVIATGTNTVFIEVFADGGLHNYYNLELSAEPAPTEPDVVVDDIALTSGSFATIFEPITYDVALSNGGFGDANDLNVSIYLSDNSSLDTEEDLLIETRIVPAVLSYDSTTLNFSYLFPSDTETGNYYLFAVADPENLIEETDENNNSDRTSAFRLDSECIGDAWEPNDDFATATLLQPAGSELHVYDNLSICDQGRDDFFLVCVDANVDLQHLGVLVPDAASNAGMEISIFDLDQNLINEKHGTTYGLISYALTSSCTGDGDCSGDETCVADRCTNSENKHCVYLQTSIYSSGTSVITRPYQVIVDTMPANMNGEPLNNDRSSAIPMEVDFNSLDNDDDADWYAVDLTAGTSFTVNLNTADHYGRIGVYRGSSSTATTCYPQEPRTINITSDQTVYFKVYRYNPTDGRPDVPAIYQVEIDGLFGVDLVPHNLTADISQAEIGDAVLMSFGLANELLTDAPASVQYAYYLSEDEVLDGSDYQVQLNTSAGPTGFTEYSIQEKVYLNAPSSWFGNIHIVLAVDPDDLVEEVDTSNNSLSVPLLLEHQCSADTFDSTAPYNNSLLNAADAIAATMEGQLSICANDQDWYVYTATDTGDLTFSINDMKVYDLGDIDFFLYNDSGSLLAVSDNLNTASESITYALSAGDTVYIKVEAFRSYYSNNYTLSIE